MKSTLTLLFLVSIVVGYSQENDINHLKLDSSVIFKNPDFYPQFKNKFNQSLQGFIAANIQYPKSGECISGNVYVSFIVDTIGNTKDVKVKKGLTPFTDNEAIRIVKLLTFIPGSFDGKVVEMNMTIPISFKIK